MKVTEVERKESTKHCCGNGWTQKNRAEHEGYARARRSFNQIWKERDSAQPELLEKILYKDNLNRAYKRVKANKGAPGIDGMTIEAALPWLREHKDELIGRIKRGKYTPSPVDESKFQSRMEEYESLVFLPSSTESSSRR